ncbi:hypothetical protein MTO96_011565 [Rhipicephalus appendiculatus]
MRQTARMHTGRCRSQRACVGFSAFEKRSGSGAGQLDSRPATNAAVVPVCCACVYSPQPPLRLSAGEARLSLATRAPRREGKMTGVKQGARSETFVSLGGGPTRSPQSPVAGCR